MAFDFLEATIETFHRALLSGEATCEDFVKYYLGRIEKYDRKNANLNAVILVNPNALKEAQEKDRYFKANGLKGKLFGVPVLLKDNIETEDMPTTAGSKSLEGWETHRDAFIVKKLREAGAIIIAKTNLHEFAVWGETISSILGQSYNPYDHTRTPGGSSGGTGAGLAANFGLAGIGTDTINSIRSPSSANSLCGIRPTMGLVSRMGIVPYSLTQDTAGPLARTVSDAVKVLDVIAGYDSQDKLTEDSNGKIPQTYTAYLKADALKGKRLGVLRSFMGSSEEHAQVNGCMEKCFEVLRKSGATLVDITEKIDSGHLVKDISVHIHDLKAHLGEYLSEFGNKVPVHSIDEILASGKYSPDIEENLKQANSLDINAPYYKERLKLRAELQKQVVDLMDKYNVDAMIYPHQQQLVCKAGASQQQRNGALGSVTGYPSIVVPGGFSEKSSDAPIGVPVGLEILGRPFDEGRLIEIAYSFEQASHFRKPPVLD